MRVAYALALILCVSLLAACSKSDCKKDLTGLDNAAPCLNITEADDGGAVGKPQCYVEPQMCPGKGGFPFCERAVDTTFRDSLEITNMGDSDLVISSVVARGNAGCAFIEPELRDPDGGVPMTVKPQEMILFSFRFTPPEAQPECQAYTALVEFTSNAQNFPVLRVPMCGRGLPKGSPPSPVNDAGVQECGKDDCLKMCPDVSAEQPTACGWDRLAGTGG